MKTNLKKSKAFVVAVILVAFVSPLFTFAQIPNIGGANTGGQSFSGAAKLPSIGGKNTSGATTLPSTGGANTSGATTLPSVGGKNISGATTLPSVGGQSTSGASASTNDTVNNSTSDTGSHGSSGSRRRNSSTTASAVNILPTLTNISQCDYLTSYLKYGANNSFVEVTKLQNFLKNTENIQVEVTGIFDLQTLAAVHAFQTRYKSDIMTPWGVTNTSGFVYITTTKKINEIFCKKTFALNPAQIGEIESYRRSVVERNNQATVNTNVKIPTTPTNINSTTSTEIGSNTDLGESQIAGAEKVKSEGKVWNFVKWLFGVDIDKNNIDKK